MPKFTITTLGCKVNQYESEALAQKLSDDGQWVISRDKEIADLCIINTCTVTQKASMQSRQAIRQAIRSHPKARIIVTGCYAQTEPDEINKIKGVHHVIGHFDKHKLPDMILAGKENILPQMIKPTGYFPCTSTRPAASFTITTPAATTSRTTDWSGTSRSPAAAAEVDGAAVNAAAAPCTPRWW